MDDDELEQREEENEMNPCEYCGHYPCKCIQLNNEIDEFLDNSATFVN